MTYSECLDIWNMISKDPDKAKQLFEKDNDMEVLSFYITVSDALRKCHELFEVDVEWRKET